MAVAEDFAQPPGPSEGAHQDQLSAAQPSREDEDDKRAAAGLAARLVGLEEPKDHGSAFVLEWILDWWDGVLETENALFSAREQPLPDCLRTTRFWHEVKPVINQVQMAKPVLESLRRGQTTLVNAMRDVLGLFGGDEERLLAWRQSLRDLAGLTKWLPRFETAREYILEAFPLGEGDLDRKRSALLESVHQPHRLLQPSAREKFDADFREYKKGYVDCYHSVHEDALGIVGAPKEAERSVDARALQNLETLSNLLYTDQSYLNRVRILGKWILRNQCQLPVRDILEGYPRCYCNFHPAGNRELAQSAAQINALIQEGIEYFRGALRRFSRTIIEEVLALKVDDFHSRQIAALLSRGPLIPLKTRTIEILNRIIESHSTEFLTTLHS